MNDVEDGQWGSDKDGLIVGPGENEDTGALVQNAGENCC